MRVLPLALALLAGCVDLKAPAAERRFYALDVARTGPAKAGAGVLKVRRFQVSRSFEGAEFVYRTSDAGYESDFYHAFFTPPASQVTEAARRWLSAFGLFAHVVEAASVAPETHLLEGNVAALYADLRDKPLAVIEVQFILLDAAGAIRLHRTHRREVPATSAAAADLISAWSKGLSEILSAAEGDLAIAVK